MHATLEPRPRAPADLRQAIANIQSALRLVERLQSRETERVAEDAVLHLRSAEGRLQRLVGC